MVEFGWQPAAGGMAGAAIAAELILVGIIFCVTGVAIAGSAFEDIVGMATGTRHAGVFAGQLEACQVVVEGSRLPAIGGVTGTTICTELTIVGIILLMTGVTILVRCFKVGNASCAGMAIPTGQSGMLSGQLECDRIVIKFVSI